MFEVNTRYGNYKQCVLSTRKCGNKHIEIQIFCEEGPLATLTTNINGIELFPENYSCVDTNNVSFAEKLIANLGIGQDTGRSLRSGFCIYPVYEFDLKKIEEYKE